MKDEKIKDTRVGTLVRSRKLPKCSQSVSQYLVMVSIFLHYKLDQHVSFCAHQLCELLFAPAFMGFRVELVEKFTSLEEHT